MAHATQQQQSRTSPIPAWLSTGLVLLSLSTLIWLERRRPLRTQRHESAARRDGRNIVMAGLAAASVQLAERPVTRRLTRYVERHRIGLTQHFARPMWLQTLAACLLLDYTLYLWHVLTHKMPILWRFHRVHHADLDMDASTGIRFHFGEMLLSVGWRAAQILTIGVSERALSIWNAALLVAVVFHHSNVELPARVERWLNKLVVTPRMHGIHHSIVPEEVNSNWSSGLTIWDHLHRTFRMDVPQERLTLGLPELRDPAQVTLPKLVVMPFQPHPAPPNLPTTPLAPTRVPMPASR